MNFLGPLLSLIANWLGLCKQRSEQNNRPDVIRGQVAKDENALVDQTAKNVAAQDVEALRKELSE